MFKIKHRRRTFNIVCEYEQEIPQWKTAVKPMAPRWRATQQPQDTSRETNQSNQLFPPIKMIDTK